MYGTTLSTEQVSKLFFEQIKRMSIESCRPDAVHAFSVTVPETTEVSVC